MFKISDSETGLSLKLTVDPKPRNPRLVNDNVFQIITWTQGLGDSHRFPSKKAFRDAFPATTTAIFLLRKVDTRKGPVLVRVFSGEKGVDGYAFAPFERLRMEFGLDKITDETRAEVLEEAETVCLTELQDYEHFIGRDVYRYEILDRRGACIETQRDLYGEEYARHMAQEAFDRHLYGVSMDG